jgi:hypothetical protein
LNILILLFPYHYGYSYDYAMCVYVKQFVRSSVISKRNLHNANKKNKPEPSRCNNVHISLRNIVPACRAPARLERIPVRASVSGRRGGLRMGVRAKTTFWEWESAGMPTDGKDQMVHHGFFLPNAHLLISIYILQTQ